MTRIVDPHGSTRQDPARRWHLAPGRSRALLWLDAAACAATAGVALLAALVGAPAVADVLGASEFTLASAGATLLIYAGLAGVVARTPSPRGLVGVAAGNVAIAGAAVLVAITTPLTVAGLGVALALVIVGLTVAGAMAFAVRGL